MTVAARTRAQTKRHEQFFRDKIRKTLVGPDFRQLSIFFFLNT